MERNLRVTMVIYQESYNNYNNKYLLILGNISNINVQVI